MKRWEEPGPRVSTIGCWLALAATLAMVGLLVVFWFSSRHRGRTWSPPAVPWSTWRPEQTPLLGDFRQDGVEDYGGVHCDDLGGPILSCNVRAIDGATFADLWKIGPFTGQASSGLRAVLAGDRVVVVDGTGWIGVYGAATGRKVAEGQASGAVSDACVGPATGALVWLDEGGGVGLFVDASSGRTTSGERPAWCPPLPPNMLFRPRKWLSLAEDAAGVLAGEKGFVVDRVLDGGSTHVAVGFQVDMWKSKTATAIAFDPRERRVLWRRSMGEHVTNDAQLGAVELSSDAVVVFYPQIASTHFALLDLRTGDIRCSRVVGGVLSVLSPTIALSQGRLAFYQGANGPGGYTHLMLRSTATCEDLPVP